MSYQCTWITGQLAAGYAPMSYDDLAVIKDEGIDAIVNLCGEFTDLHEIEEKAGFEVYYLPTPDEHAPDMEAMEKALEWLDEAVYLKKKVLVHCRHGHGRTGTFISAYLLRRGFGLKKTEKILKNTRANPTNYRQWQLLRKYHKQQGALTLAEPLAEAAVLGVDLSPFIQDYEAILNELETQLADEGEFSPCGRDSSDCCNQYFMMELSESVWIHTHLNRLLSHDDRRQVIERALECTAVVKTVQSLQLHYPGLIDEDFSEIYAATKTACPLLDAGQCLLYEKRPFHCRWYGSTFSEKQQKEYLNLLVKLSHDMYLALTGAFLTESVLQFSMAETVSGRFVQACFNTMRKNLNVR